jgi:nicotinamide-nucleotide amidase
MTKRTLAEWANELGTRLGRAGLSVATAESCTGGWVAKLITDIAGSSAWFDRGFVTYSNDAKMEMLGVDPDILRTHGAVSEATVRAMAEGALGRSNARLAVAISGIAGPGGGSAGKPVGTVWFAWAEHGAETRSARYHFDGDRDAVRRQAVAEALRGLCDCLPSGAGGGGQRQ